MYLFVVIALDPRMQIEEWEFNLMELGKQKEVLLWNWEIMASSVMLSWAKWSFVH